MTRQYLLLVLLVATDGIFAHAHLVGGLDLCQLCDSKVDNREQQSSDKQKCQDQRGRKQLFQVIVRMSVNRGKNCQSL